MAIHTELPGIIGRSPARVNHPFEWPEPGVLKNPESPSVVSVTPDRHSLAGLSFMC